MASKEDTEVRSVAVAENNMLESDMHKINWGKEIVVARRFP